MRFLIASILLINAGVARAMLNDESLWTFGANRFWEDRCYTTSVEDCVVQGSEITIRRDSNKYSVSASYAHFRSNAGNLIGNLLAIGVEDRFAPTQTTTASLQAMLNVEPDESRSARGTNSNFNKGYSLGAALSGYSDEIFNVAVPVEIGMGLIYEDKQNCSHPDCHALKEKKGRIELVQARLFLRSPLPHSRVLLTGSLSQIVVYLNKGSTNGREQRGPTIRLGFEFTP